jgi:hypothetical protein
LESTHAFQLGAGVLGENRHDENCPLNPHTAPAWMRVRCVKTAINGGATGDGTV